MINIWNLLISGATGFAGGLIGGTFKWFFPSQKDWKESRKAKAEAKIDAKVFAEIRSLGEKNSSIFVTEQIAERLKITVDEAADSLERLENIGRVQRYNIGTNDHPGPGWRSTFR